MRAPFIMLVRGELCCRRSRDSFRLMSSSSSACSSMPAVAVRLGVRVPRAGPSFTPKLRNLSACLCSMIHEDLVILQSLDS